MRDDELHDDPHAALQPSELEALRALRRAEDPGRPLEERTVKALRRQGLLATRRATARPLAWAAAAATVFFAAGFALGRGSGSTTSTSDAALRPTDRPTMNQKSDRDRRDPDRILTAAADTTEARDAARFVVWF
jgi:hypothetical protein